jgi:hypothetical protein
LAKTTAVAAKKSAATNNRTVTVFMRQQINAICVSATEIPW